MRAAGIAWGFVPSGLGVTICEVYEFVFVVKPFADSCCLRVIPSADVCRCCQSSGGKRRTGPPMTA
jgi:hypothetical protein